jgi:hypothetical protein
MTTFDLPPTFTPWPRIEQSRNVKKLAVPRLVSATIPPLSSTVQSSKTTVAAPSWDDPEALIVAEDVFEGRFPRISHPRTVVVPPAIARQTQTV